MPRVSDSIIIPTFICLLLFRDSAAVAQTTDASQLFPASTTSYLEIRTPAALMASVLDHPLTQHIQAMDFYKKATATQEYRNFLTGRKLFELQIGADWRPAVEDLTRNGIFVAFDAASTGTVVLVRGTDEATMEKFRVKVLELTRLSGDKSSHPEDYRGHPVYRIGNGNGAVIRDWFVATNNRELGTAVLDRLLNDRTNDAEQIPESLATNENFRLAQMTAKPDSQAWAYADLQSIRAASNSAKLFEGKAENPLAELLFGGIQSTLSQAPYVVAELNVAASHLNLQFSSPWQSEWIPDARTYYFGSDHKGIAPNLPEVPQTLVTLGFHRNISEMWLRAGDLFDEQTNDKLVEADSGLSTVFAGRDFGEEILGAFEPQTGIIAVRQHFLGKAPIPAIKLPAFALVMLLRDPDTMRPELRRTFQSAIGFFNIVGAQNGNPQLEMDMQKLDEAELITSRYVPSKNDRDSTDAPIIFNFSPSVGFSGNRFVLASTAALARQLIESPAPEASVPANTQLNLHASVIKDVLADNREQLIAQNMLSEGHTREEAEAAISVALDLIACLQAAEMSLAIRDGHLVLQMNVQVLEKP